MVDELRSVIFGRALLEGVRNARQVLEPLLLIGEESFVRIERAYELNALCAETLLGAVETLFAAIARRVVIFETPSRCQRRYLAFYRNARRDFLHLLLLIAKVESTPRYRRFEVNPRLVNNADSVSAHLFENLGGMIAAATYSVSKMSSDCKPFSLKKLPLEGGALNTKI
jgi:hypothetical protein